MRFLIATTLSLLATLPASAQQTSHGKLYSEPDRPIAAPPEAPGLDYAKPFKFDAVPLNKLPTRLGEDRALPVEVYTIEEMRNAKPIPAPAPQSDGSKQLGAHDLSYDPTHEENFRRLAPDGFGLLDRRSDTPSSLTSPPQQ